MSGRFVGGRCREKSKLRDLLIQPPHLRPDDFQPSIDFLQKNGVEVFNIEDRKEGVFWGPQAYFLDPDGNKLEIYAGPGARDR